MLRGVQAEGPQAGPMRRAAVQFVHVLSALLQLLPLHPFFQQGASWAGRHGRRNGACSWHCVATHTACTLLGHVPKAADAISN